MKFNLIPVAALLSSMLVGCSNGHVEHYKGDKMHVDAQIIGVPILLGGHGSSVPLTEKLSLTAAHVAKFDYSNVVAYHPECDLAIIEKNNDGKKIPKIGKVFQEELVYTIGKALPLPTHNMIGEGIYLRDVSFPDNKYYKKCPASLLSSPVQMGMSGGGAFNQDYELVGILSAMAGNMVEIETGKEIPDSTIVVPLLYAEEWIKKTVKKYESR